MSKNICKTLALALLFLVILTVPAEAGEHKKEEGQKKEYSNHFKFYGFIRNFFAYDTRESVAGTGDLFYYLPKDVDMNSDGSQDLNASPSFRFLSITSRVGLDVYGYQYGKTRFGAKIETDFYAGLTNTATSSKINGTAQLRLRQAYMTLGWDDLPMSGKTEASVSLLMGQAWHPMAADQPHVVSLETGAPFNAFSRTPQVTMNADLGKTITLTGAAIWQMQYLSTGPSGSSAEYIRNSCVPEFYLGLTMKSNDGFLARAGASILSIKPRRLGENNQGVEVKVSDRITTVSPYLYMQYRHKSFEVKAKTIYSQAGEHMNLMSGYGISKNDFEDGHYEYTPLQTSSTWLSMTYGTRWQFMLMGGYIKNLGAVGDLVNTDGVTDPDNFYFSSNGSKNLNSMWRIIPTVAYNAGKFSVALEYNMTSAQYGDGKTYNSKGLSLEGLHWVSNHRVQMMFRFTF